MKIDPTIVKGEDALRAGIDSAIHSYKPGMLDKFADLTPKAAAFAITLAQRVILEILDDARPDGMTPDDYAELSVAIADIDAWAGYDAPTIRTFLEELAAGNDHTASDVDVSYLLVLCAAYLVYEFANDDEEWEDYLQAVEDDILFPDGANKPQPIQPQ